MKAEGAKRNTHIVTVQGMAVKDDRLYPMPLNVRFTADRFGETISIEAEYMGLMLAVPFEDVWKMIQEARKAKNDR